MKNYSGEFEVHMTMGIDSVASPGELERLRVWCDERKLKFVHIQLSRGDFRDQPMASWRRSDTTLATVRNEADALRLNASAAGFDVTRLKIEVAATNKDVPDVDAQAAAEPSHCYFEHHVKLRRPVEASLDDLRVVGERHGAHLSRNAFTRTSAGHEERFVTLRNYEIGRATSLSRLQNLLEAIDGLGEHVIDVESEYCVFDSNLELDRNWLAIEDAGEQASHG